MGWVRGIEAPFSVDVEEGPLRFPKPSPPSRPPMMSLRSPSRPSAFMSQEAAAAAAMADMALLVTSSSESSSREDRGRCG